MIVVLESIMWLALDLFMNKWCYGAGRWVLAWITARLHHEEQTRDPEQAQGR